MVEKGFKCIYLYFIVVDYRGQPTEPTNITGSTNEAIVSHQSFTHVSAAEYEFETTIRSCLGTFCFDEPVKRRNAKNAKESFTRIGILFPFSSDPDSTKEIKLLLKLIDSSGNIRNNIESYLVFPTPNHLCFVK